MQFILPGVDIFYQDFSQSGSFMGTYVGIFQYLLCQLRWLHGNGLVRRDWRYGYWLMGFLSSASVFLEKKHRRTELTLYVIIYNKDMKLILYG